MEQRQDPKLSAHAVISSSPSMPGMFSGAGKLWNVRIGAPFNGSAGGFLSLEAAMKWAKERSSTQDVI